MRSRPPRTPSSRPGDERGRHRRVSATHPAVVYAPALVLSAAVALPSILGLVGPAGARPAAHAMALPGRATPASPLAHASPSPAPDASPTTTPDAPTVTPPGEAGALRAERALRRLPSAAATSAAPRPLWVRPDVGHLSSGYGYRPSMGDFHPGIDLAGPYGSPIRAAAAGRIVFAGPASGFGQEIRIRHAGGVVTVYGHMSRILVRSGAVRAGQVIALEGSEGHSTGPHLHFEVWIDGTRVDPLPFLRRHGVRIR